MKVWRFYKKPKNEKTVPIEDIPDAYPLYACTQEKKYAKKFKETRNMDCFIERVTNADSATAEHFLNAHRNRILSNYTLQTVISSPNGEAEPYYIRCIVTENEMEYLSELTDTNQILNFVKGFFPIDYFSENVMESLLTLRYDKYINFRIEGFGNSPDGFYDTNFRYDMFRTYMLLYHHTYRDDFVVTSKYYREDEISEDEWRGALKSGMS